MPAVTENRLKGNYGTAPVMSRLSGDACSDLAPTFGGPSVITVGLGADFQIAHCAAISFGPTRDSPSRLLPSAVFFPRRYRPAAQRKKIRRRISLGSALASRSGRPKGKFLNGNVGSSLAGRSNRNWGPLSDHG